MSLIRRRIAERLVSAQQQAALLTTFNEIDMSAVKQLRAEYRDAFQTKYGMKLGFMSFFVKAVVDALKSQPALNAEIRDNKIVYHHYYHIGIAVSSTKGLVVPVLRSADRLSFAEIEQAIADFGARASSNKLEPADLEGGTFTITNGGIFGSLLSTPIVNPPQSGVLGMHAIQDRPVAREWRGRHPPHDVRRPHLRPPPGRRPRSRNLPGAHQRSARRPFAHAVGNLSATRSGDTRLVLRLNLHTFASRRSCRASCVNFAGKNARINSSASASPMTRDPRHSTFILSCSTPW